MSELGMSGSVGALGEQSHGATRPTNYLSVEFVWVAFWVANLPNRELR